MGANEELEAKTAGTAGTAPAGARPSTPPVTEPVAPSDAPDIPAELVALVEERIKAREAEIRQEYEGKDGHISKVKSERDKLKAQLEKQERERRQRVAQQAQEVTGRLSQLDPELAGQVQAVMNYQQQDQIRQQMGDWMRAIAEDLGGDLEDEDLVAVMAEQADLLVENPAFSHDAQQAIARQIATSQRALAEKERKARQSLEDKLPEMVDALLTQKLAGLGVTTLGDGAQPRGRPAGKPTFDWKNPTLMAEALEELPGRKR